MCVCAEITFSYNLLFNLFFFLPQGFYCVYDSVFNRVADEEEEYSTEESERLPRFGGSFTCLSVGDVVLL